MVGVVVAGVVVVVVVPRYQSGPLITLLEFLTVSTNIHNVKCYSSKGDMFRTFL